MLYQDIRWGCEIYHQNEEISSLDRVYRNYLTGKNQTKWDNPETLDLYEVEILVDFANKWKSRMPSNANNIMRLLNNLRSAVPVLNTLRGKAIFDVNFAETLANGKSISQIISDCFDTIAQTNRYESVAASKMMNAAINPGLFVMWDTAIQRSYYMGRNGYAYAYRFLPQMQELARRAVNEAMDKEGLSLIDAIASFTNHCENKNTLAKIIDEYNYAKFTLESPMLR